MTYTMYTVKHSDGTESRETADMAWYRRPDAPEYPNRDYDLHMFATLGTQHPKHLANGLMAGADWDALAEPVEVIGIEERVV